MKVTRQIPLVILFGVLLSFSVQTYCFPESDRPPDYSNEWSNALRKGDAKEKQFALLRTFTYISCCQYRKDPEALDLILGALEDEDPYVREAAAACLAERIDPYSIECCRETQIVPSLVKTLEDRNAHARAEAARALASLKDERAVDGLIKRLGDQDPWVRLNAAFALGELKTLKAVDPMLRLLEDDSDWRNKFVQQECVMALRKIGAPAVIGSRGGTAYVATVGRPPDDKIITELKAQRNIPSRPTKIGGFDDETTAKVISVLVKKSNDPYLRALIIAAFSQFEAVEAREILLSSMNDPDEAIRKLAIGALSWLPESEDQKFQILKTSLKDPSIPVRISAATLIARLKDPRVVDPLAEALRDSDQTVQLNAIKGLAQFKEERILGEMTPFLGSDRTHMHEAAVNTFMSVARNSTKERVYVYRKDGMRHAVRNLADTPPRGRKSERLIHPKAVENLLDFIHRSDQKRKLAALDLFSHFEDRRIEQLLVRLLDDPSPELRRRAIALSPLFCEDVVIPKLIEASMDKNAVTKKVAIGALGQFEDKKAFKFLIERLNDQDALMRAAALDALRGHEDPRLLDLTIKLLGDESEQVKRSAIRNIRDKPDEKAVEALILMLNDGDPFFASTSAEMLGVIRDKRAINPLIKALKGEFNRNRPDGGDAKLRMNAATAIGRIGDPGAVPALTECLSDEDPYVRRRVIGALKHIRDPAGLEAIKYAPKDNLHPEISSGIPAPKVLSPSPQTIRKDQMPVLGSGYSYTMPQEKKGEKPPPAKEEKPAEVSTPHPARTVSKYHVNPRPSIDIIPLLTRLKANDPKTRRQAADSLGDAGNQEAADHLIPLLKDKDEYVRQAAARALGKLKDKKAVEPLIATLKDPEIDVRAFSIWALGEIQDPKAVEPLCSFLLDREDKIRNHGFEALRKFRDPASRRIMVNFLVRGAKSKDSAKWTLSKLVSLEGKEVILRAMEDSEGDKAKTLRNYIDLMEANLHNISEIGRSALLDDPDKSMVISELANYVNNHEGTPAASISLLSGFEDPRVLTILLEALSRRKDSGYRSTVIAALGKSVHKSAAEPLLHILVDEKEFPRTRAAAARALAEFKDVRAVEPLLQILKGERENRELRGVAVSVLGDLRDKRGVEPLITILKNRNEDPWLRMSAVLSLEKIADERAIPALEEAAKGPLDGVRSTAEYALSRMRTAGKK